MKVIEEYSKQPVRTCYALLLQSLSFRNVFVEEEDERGQMHSHPDFVIPFETNVPDLFLTGKGPILEVKDEASGLTIEDWMNHRCYVFNHGKPNATLKTMNHLDEKLRASELAEGRRDTVTMQGILTHIVEEYPDDVRAHKRLANLFERQRYYDKMKYHLMQVIRIYESVKEYHIDTCRCR